MTKAEEYRQKAEEADRTSKGSKDYQAKRMYSDVARQWREMAEQADRNGW